MAHRIPVGVLVLLLTLTSTAGLVVGAFILFRPDWLGLGTRAPSAQQTDAAADTAGIDTTGIEPLQLPSPWEELQEQLRNATAAESQLRDSLHTLRRYADSLRGEVERLHAELQRWQQHQQQQSDSTRLHHYQAFARIYDNAPPEEVARILEQLPPSDVALLLKLMNRKQAARVLALLPPEHAAATLTLNAGTQR